MKKLVIVVLVLAAVAVGAYVLIGRQPGTGTGTTAPVAADAPLNFVPADSPYVFANIEPLPPEVIAQWQRQFADVKGLYAAQLDHYRELAKAAGSEDKTLDAMVEALDKEFGQLKPSEYAPHIGISPQAHAALYGLGLLPVLRIELAEPEKFRGFVTRMETAAGAPIPTAEVEGQKYWSFTSADAPLQGVVAIVGTHLVASLAPREATAPVLRQILGMDRPAQSAAAAGTLTALNDQYGFKPFFTGYFDTRRILAAATAAPGPIEAEFLKALGTPKTELDPVCKAEFESIAAAWPRLLVGYRKFDASSAEVLSVLETNTEIAQALMKLRAPMPGLSAVKPDSLFNMGMSLKLAALPEVVAGFADKTAANPWQCPMLADLNKAFADAKTQVANPAMFMAVPVFHGFHVTLDTLDIGAAGGVPTGTGVLVIGSDNPETLLGMAKGFVPEVANLKLTPGGEPQPLTPPAGTPLTEPLHVAMGERTLAISVGAGKEAELKQHLTSDPQQMPLLVFGIRGKLYEMIGQQVGDMMVAQAADKSPEEQEKLRQEAELMKQLYANMFERVDTRLDFTERGIEMSQSVVMKR